MNFRLLTLIFMLVTQFVTAQIVQRNILNNKYTQQSVASALLPVDEYHPYPQTPDAWKSAVPDSVITQLIRSGEQYLNYEFLPISATIALDFVRSGDRERHSGISFEKRNALMALVLAESVEGKGRFNEAILNGIWSICEESYWGVPAHIGGTGLPDVENPKVDLFTAETASVLALADYFAGAQMDAINPLVRKRIYHETRVRFFEPILKSPDAYGWMSKTQPVNNWNPWIMSNWISSALLIEKDKNYRQEIIYNAMLGLDRYLNSLGEDGGCDEGPSYWTAAGASVYDCLELLGYGTRQLVNIYDHPLVQKMGAYFYKVHIANDYFVNFADADPKLRPDGYLLVRFGNAIKDERMATMGDWAVSAFPESVSKLGRFHRFRSIQNILSVKSAKTGVKSYPMVPDAWLSDIQVLTARDTDSGLFLATHGGHNAESHNHNDVGDFILYSKGQPVIIDAGRGNYTARTFSSKRYDLWFTQSQHHNLPIINNIGQKQGRDFKATQVQSNINEKAASLMMDIAAAYPTESGVEKWIRTVSLNRAKNELEIGEQYKMKGPLKSLTEVFMTIADVDISKPGTVLLHAPDGQNFVLKYDVAKWSVATDFPSTDGMEYRSFKTKWDSHPVQRILLTAKELKPESKFKFVISAQ